MGVVMGGRGAVWMLFPPFAAAGWLGAHTVAYVLVAPDDHRRGELLAESGHGYLAAAPLVLACAVTLVVAGLVMAIHDGLRGGPRKRIPLWPLALVPPLGFGVQEHVERLIELGTFPTGAALEPTFLLGMALQLPFALAAVMMARAVLALGRLIGRGLAYRPSPRPHGVATSWRLPDWIAPVPIRPLASSHGERAPPGARIL